MRIMFQANAPWCTTGYGVQGKHLVPRLKKLGHEVAYFAFYGLENGVLHSDGVPIYPKGTTLWGQDIVDAHMKHFRADLLISLLDVWVLTDYGKLAEHGGWLWCPWTPVDQEPVPKPVLERLKGAFMVLPYARYGEEQLRLAGITNVRYIPHGVNTKTFTPGDKREARRVLKLPEDAFIIGMVAANKGFPSRKSFPEQLVAFAEFKKRHPEAIMYLHTLEGTGHGGINFPDLLARLELVRDRDVFFSDQYTYMLGWTESRMALLYRAFDVLSLVSQGEGFGIPIIEAQACGCPVVTAKNTAMPELTFAGVCVEEQQLWWTPLGSFARIPSIPAIVAAYETMYEQLHDEARARELSEQAVMGARAFDWDVLIERFWSPFLAEVQEELDGRRQPHRWARVGLYNSDGSVSVPCLDKDCAAELVKRNGKGDLVKGRSFGMRIGDIGLDIEDHPEGAVAKVVCREIERATWPALVELGEGDVAVDVGAHVGVVSIYLAKRWPKATIIAIEPVKENYDRLLRNLAANGVSNVIALNTAITGDGRVLRLDGNLARNSGGMSAYGAANGPEDQRVSIASRTLCSIFREYGIKRCRLLKLDCEGAEYEILHGDSPLHKVDYLIGEFHTSEMLKKLGYTPEALRDECVALLGPDRVHVQIAELNR